MAFLQDPLRSAVKPGLPGLTRSMRAVTDTTPTADLSSISLSSLTETISTRNALKAARAPPIQTPEIEYETAARGDILATRPPSPPPPKASPIALAKAKLVRAAPAASAAKSATALRYTSILLDRERQKETQLRRSRTFLEPQQMEEGDPFEKGEVPLIEFREEDKNVAEAQELMVRHREVMSIAAAEGEVVLKVDHHKRRRERDLLEEQRLISRLKQIDKRYEERRAHLTTDALCYQDRVGSEPLVGDGKGSYCNQMGVRPILWEASGKARNVRWEQRGFTDEPIPEQPPAEQIAADQPDEYAELAKKYRSHAVKLDKWSKAVGEKGNVTKQDLANEESMQFTPKRQVPRTTILDDGIPLMRMSDLAKTNSLSEIADRAASRANAQAPPGERPPKSHSRVGSASLHRESGSFVSGSGSIPGGGGSRPGSAASKTNSPHSSSRPSSGLWRQAA